MGLDLYVLATLQKKLEVWFRTISDSAMIYITADVGSGLYPVAHRVICYCGKIKVPQSGNSQVSNGVPVSLFTRLVSTC